MSKKSLNEWSLTYFNNNVFDTCMKFAEGSSAPPLDFLFKLTEMLDGYSLYLRGPEDKDEDN